MQNSELENAKTRGHGMNKYIIDPVLETVCLPLAKDEYETLERQILRDGCLDPVKVWDRDGEMILLDGHNRLKICHDNKLPIPESTTIEIDSIDEAIIWIVDNQRGRRNVATKEQQDYISGKRYEAQKNINKFKGNQYTSNGGDGKICHDQNAITDNIRNKTAYKQGLDEGISSRAVRNNATFSRGVDAVREVSPTLAEKILKPSSDTPKLTKQTVSALPKLKEKEPEKFKEAVEDIEEALETKDRVLVELVVRDHIRPNEPTNEEKMIAKKNGLKPEHVQYAHEHDIPIEKLKTIKELDSIESRKHITCSTTWDGFYECECGIKFEIFGSKCSPKWCPQCGKENSIKRIRC
jgi:hypothetical protein